MGFSLYVSERVERARGALVNMSALVIFSHFSISRLDKSSVNPPHTAKTALSTSETVKYAKERLIFQDEIRHATFSCLFFFAS